MSETPDSISEGTNDIKSWKRLFPKYIMWRDSDKLCHIFNQYDLRVDTSKPIKTKEEFLKYRYPYFYVNKEFKELMTEIEVWIQMQNSFYTSITPISSKRCILLYGPPGTGKSFSTLVGAHLADCQLLVYNLMNLSEEMFVAKFREHSVEGSTIILFEDIDVYFEYHRNNIKCDMSLYSKNITKPSTFFNMIDGVNKNIRSMIIYTTNFPDKLDKRMVEYDKENDKIILTRPGRVDKAIYFGYTNVQAINHTVNGLCKIVNETYENVIENEKRNEIINNIMDEYYKLNGKMTISQVTNMCYLQTIDILRDKIGGEFNVN